MNLDEIKNHLHSLATSENIAYANAATFIQDSIQQVEAGAMSPSEASEVFQDVQRQFAVMAAADDLALKETLNTVLNGLIAIAGAA